MPPLFAPAAPEALPEYTVVELIKHSALIAPNGEAVICGEHRINWQTFDLRVNKVANALISAGIKKGDRVAILASTSIEYVEIFMGTLRAGACIVPLSTMSTTQALQKMVEDCGAKIFFLSQSMRELVEDFLQSLPSINPGNLIALDFENSGWENYEEWLSAASDKAPNIEIDYDDLFNIIYSSGTTGTPKGILHDHMMRANQMARVQEHGYTNETRTLLSTPLYSNTTIVALLPTLVAGGTVVLMPKFDASKYLELVEKEHCTHTMLVPVQYKRIMDVPEFDTFDLSSMLMKFSTSAPLRAALKEDVLKRFPGGLTEYYGLTEGGGTTVLLAHLHPDKLASVGQPAPDVELKFIDDEGTEVAKGKMGEICGRSPAMMSGYFGRDDLTNETLWQDSEGKTFFRSGDLGYIDEDGFVFLGDRKKDMIISGGLNIYANDLELALLQDDDVEDAAVIGVPSEAWGETPFGFIVVRKGATRGESDILATANNQLGKSQRLSDVKIVQSLPRSQIGKILKRELRADYEKTASQQ
ncbi:MAG: 4-coumarate--CoA ligase [Hyphomicrobiales bacterium]|nr:MAG: 4-coumarate--CoA ligase [Hyphomicrobiales bacterium]